MFFFAVECRCNVLGLPHLYALDKKVTLLSMKLPGVALRPSSRNALIDEIVLTNKIEGVHSSREGNRKRCALEILSKQSQEKGKQQRFVGLVNKISSNS